jgi:Tol biopolymer transport system component
VGEHQEAVRGSSSSRLALILLVGMMASAAAHAQTVRIDVTPSGVPADRRSLYPVVSYDGRYLAFLSGATNLVEGDTDNSYDFFRYDRLTGQMIRGDAIPFIGGGVTIPPPFVAAISQDGRWLLFHDDRPDWVLNDTNHDFDSFQYDFATGTVRRVTVGTGGVQANGTSRGLSMSADGRYVAFHSNASNIGPPELAGIQMDDVFVHDTQTGETVQVSRGVGNVAANGASVDAVMSPDGEWVAFTSAATNLTNRADTNGVRDVFVAHWRTGDVLRVRPRDDEANQASAVGVLSWDARDVVFCSTASNLGPGLTDSGAKTVVWNRLSGAITYANPTAPARVLDCSNFSLRVGISRRGRYITMPDSGITQYGRDAGQTLRVDSVAEWHEMSGTGVVVVFGRENGVYAWTGSVPPDGLLPATDSDSDGLPDIWEEEFGLSPFSGQGADGPDGDPDADGVDNLAEFQAGSHPKGLFRRFLAEGATGSFFSTRIALFNPSAAATTTVVRLLTDAGRISNQTVRLNAHGVLPMNAAAFPGMGGASFSIVTESDTAIVVERTMTWDASRYGAHTESAVAAPSTTWYFAEGSTVGDFEVFYLLLNPQPEPVNVTVRFPTHLALRTFEKHYTLPPLSRTTIYVDTEDPLLRTAVDVYAVIRASQPIVAERAMYMNRPGQPFAAGHASVGVTAPALSWFLAEGATGVFFDTYVVLLNPTDQEAICEVRYLTSGGRTYTKPYTLAADSRTRIFVDDEVIAGLGHVLHDVEVSTMVTSLNNVPIVVERAMWWTSSDLHEAHASPGVTAAKPFWAIADGESGGVGDAQTYLLLANTSPVGGDVLVTVYFEEGGSVQRVVPMEPLSRVTINLGEFPFANGRRFAATALALGNSPISLVVERATYWNASGVFWAAGTNAVATPLPWAPGSQPARQP